MEVNKIYCGSCLDVLKTFPDECVDCVVTSPPYWGLRDYGTAKWEGGSADCDHNPQKPDGGDRLIGLIGHCRLAEVAFIVIFASVVQSASTHSWA